MKKKLSRLLCVLLVLTMVFAMVPAVSAAAGDSDATPIDLYVGDSTTDKFGCTESGHETVVTYTNYFSGKADTPSTYNSYLTYNTRTRVFYANAASYDSSTRIFGAVKVDVKCKDTSCTKNNAVKYYRVFSKAESVTLSDASNNRLSGSVNIGTSGTDIYFSVSPVSAMIKNGTKDSAGNITAGTIKATIDDSSVATFDNGTDTCVIYKTTATGKMYFTVKAASTEASAETDLTITTDVGTSHEKSATITLVTGTSGILTVKRNNEILAQSNYGEKDIRTVSDVKVGNPLTLTATASNSVGKLSDVKWSSSKSSVAAIDSSTTNGSVTFSIMGAGETTISAKLNGKVAKFNLSVLSDIERVRALDNSNNEVVESKSLKVGEDFTVKAEITPSRYESTSKASVVWTSSDPDVVGFDTTDTNHYNRDDGSYKNDTAKLYAKNRGTARITATLGSKTYSFNVTVTQEATTYNIKSIPNARIQATIRTGTRSEIVDRLNANSLYTSIPGEYQVEKTVNGQTQKVTYTRPIPVEWNDASISSDGKTAVARGRVMSTDGQANFTFASGCTTTVTADVTLTDDAAVTGISITSNKDTAVENDTVRLTARASVEPSSAAVTYQWAVNGRDIDKATSATLTYTIPKASVDSSLEYKFTCKVTATYNKAQTTSTSQPYTVSVDREYSVSVQTTSSKSSYTVGEKIDLRATLYRLGSAQSSSAFSWQLFDSNGDNLSSNIATVSGNGATATVTTKAVKSAKGEKIVVRATSDYKGYSSSETITVMPAEAATVTQSVGSGDTIKASNITSAVTRAAGSNASVSYVIFDTTRSCTLSKSSSSSSSVVDTKCYISGSGQKLSDVYVKTSASTASATYVAYDADDYVLATGTISFDTNEASETLSFSGATLKTCGGVSQIADKYPNASYVKFDLPKETDAKLYFDYTKISNYSRLVKSSDKYYLDAGKNDDSVEDVFVLPVYGATGTLKIDYTAYSSSNSDLGTGTISLTVKSKTASAKFTDVTSSNTGYWSADSIDFGVDNGLFSGKTSYRFDPEGAMDRGMLVTVLYRAAGEPSVSGISNPFTDVKQKDYFYNAVLWAYKNKVVTGTSADKFSPTANVTREQIAAILYRYMGEPTATGSLSGYSDRAKISSYATTAMQWAIGKGYITGTTKTTLAPDGKATRAQVAVMLHRFLTF